MSPTRTLSGSLSSCSRRARVTSCTLPTECPSRKTGNCEMPLACKRRAASAAVVSDPIVTSVRGPRARKQVADRLRRGIAPVQMILGQPRVVIEFAQIIAPVSGQIATMTSSTESRWA